MQVTHTTLMQTQFVLHDQPPRYLFLKESDMDLEKAGAPLTAWQPQRPPAYLQAYPNIVSLTERMKSNLKQNGVYGRILSPWQLDRPDAHQPGRAGSQQLIIDKWQQHSENTGLFTLFRPL